MQVRKVERPYDAGVTIERALSFRRCYTDYRIRDKRHPVLPRDCEHATDLPYTIHLAAIACIERKDGSLPRDSARCSHHQLTRLH